ncbi:hypothetical protein [Echinicola sp. 20G]|uniref:hypothetical protein n=1 Tax=Echinicola sp. 20G TaxID=2781961 RepID=UPI001910146C|nr:hypothetical protein [Echinicola sp. 20G]
MYNTKYSIQYKDLYGVNTTVNIKLKDYQGELIELDKFGVDPLFVKWFGEGGSKFQTIQQSEARISLLSQFNFEFIEFADFEEKQYLVEVIKGGLLYWVGFLLPDNYRESYVTPPYEIELLAIDYLTTLKDIDFTDDLGNNIYETKSLLEVLIIIFEKIGLDLPIYDGIDVKYDVSVTSTLAATKVNCKKYVDDVNSDNPKPWNCQDVLEEILKTFGATLKQNQGRWEISHFDNPTKSFQKYSYSGFYLGEESIEKQLYLDDYEVKIIDESGELEIEGAKKSLEITHKVGKKENIIKGGDFKLSSSWKDTNDLQNWEETNINILKTEEGILFQDYYNDLSYTGGNLFIDSKVNFIKSEPIPVAHIPVSLIPNKNDKYFDINFLMKLTPLFTEPPEFTSDPNYNFEQYYTYKEDQINQLIDNCDIGSLFSIRYTDSTGEYWLNQDPDLIAKLEEGDLQPTPVAVGRNYRSEWTPTTTKQYFNYLNGDRVEYKELEVSSNRNIYKEVSWVSGYDKKEFLKGFYNYQQRIYLYKDQYEQQIPLIAEDGYFEFYVYPPYVWNLTSTISGIPTEYQLTFTDIDIELQQVSIESNEIEEQNLIILGDNQKNIKKLDGFDVEMGDGDALIQSSLLKSDGQSVTELWIRSNQNLPILQHTANRIIKQYKTPSMIFRAKIATEETIDLNTVLYNPMTDKYFIIQGLELNDKEGVYEIELRELLQDVEENEQLNFIKSMTYTHVDNEDGYSINLEE